MKQREIDEAFAPKTDEEIRAAIRREQREDFSAALVALAAIIFSFVAIALIIRFLARLILG